LSHYLSSLVTHAPPPAIYTFPYTTLFRSVEIDINDFMQNCKRMRGIVEGDAVAEQFIPRLIDLHLQGRFPFDKLIKMYPFEKIKDRKSTRLNSSHVKISYAVFCLKKKKNN